MAHERAPGLKNRGLNGSLWYVDVLRYAGASTWMLTLRTMSLTIAR